MSATTSALIKRLSQTATEYPEGLAGGRGRVGPKRSRGTNEKKSSNEKSED